MSTIIMSACWPLQMPSAAKAVLMSLADNANDQGVCWPSQPHIAMRTCLSVRAVRNAIKWLESSGYLSVDRSNGRHATYELHPTPARGAAPAPDAAPARGAAEPRHEVPQPRHQVPQPRHQVPPNHKEPSRTVRSNRQDGGSPADLLPDVPADVARDYIAIRKAKKAPLTETAVAGLLRESEKAGITLADAIRICCERGWVGFKADWVTGENAGGRKTDTLHSPEPRRSFREVSL